MRIAEARIQPSDGIDQLSGESENPLIYGHFGGKCEPRPSTKRAESSYKKNLAPQVGFEPPPFRLTGYRLLSLWLSPVRKKAERTLAD
jgi:hypothetical protein